MCRFRLECRVLDVYEAMISISYDEDLRKGKNNGQYALVGDFVFVGMRLYGGVRR